VGPNDAYDLVVIGGDPAGRVAAIEAARRGRAVALVEPANAGVASSAGRDGLLETAGVARTLRHAADFGIDVGRAIVVDLATARRRWDALDAVTRAELDGQLKAEKIDRLEGRATLVAPGRVRLDGGRRELHAPHVVLATGAQERSVADGITDGSVILSTADVLRIGEVPRTAVVVGGGAAGCELVSLLSELGTRVTVVERGDQLLPSADHDVASTLRRSFARRDITVITSANAVEVSGATGAASLELEPPPDKLAPARLDADIVVLATGRRPRSAGLADDGSGVEFDESGYVIVDELMRTGAPGVFAIGDLVATPPLEHVGRAEARLVVSVMLGSPESPVDYAHVARCIYTAPEVAYVGLSERGSREVGFDIAVVRDSFAGNGRALVLGESEGFVKLIVEKLPDGTAGSLLGVHMIGPRVTEQISQGGLALSWAASPAELAGLLQAHPTLSEAYGESLLSLAGRGLHLG
jgi:dihydrolipoamide dehydrogenase